MATPDQIIQCAREAGLRYHIPFFSDSEVVVALARFAKLVAQHEREQCARICDGYAENSRSPMNFADNCAIAIRAIKD